MLQRCTALISLLVLLVIGSCVYASNPSAVTPETSVWFAGKETHGLRVGLLWIDAGDKLLRLDCSPGDLYGACYYPSAGILMTVGKDTTVRLYESADGKLVLRKSKLLRSRSQPLGVRFTRVPGLVYVTYDFVPPPPPPEPKQGFFQSLLSRVAGRKPVKTRCINNMSQHYTWECRRVVLRDSARDWYGFPSTVHEIGQPKPLLDGCYQVQRNGKAVTLIPSQGQHINLVLSQSLGEPVVHFEMLRSVWVFPGHGIVLRTKSGWSLHKPDGRLVKWFDEGDVHCWYGPAFINGSFYACQEVPYCYHPPRYQLDTNTGRMLKEEWSEKKHKYVPVRQ